MTAARRVLRFARGVSRKLRSKGLISWYQLLFANLTIGRGVRLGRHVDVNIIDGGRLDLGEGSDIETNVQLVAEGSLVIGPRAFVGRGSTIVAASSVTIGADALIAAYVTIRDQDHGMEQGAGPYASQPKVSEPIIIGDNVWLGSNVTVLRGVEIGDGCVVGAGSVVITSLPPYSLAVGAPARVVRSLR